MIAVQEYARELLQRTKQAELPIQEEEVAAALSAVILPYSKAEDLLQALAIYEYAQGIKGLSFYYRNIPYICYAASLSIVDRRDTILHECAHIFLGHLSDGAILGKCADRKTHDAQEQEANEFAVAALAPAHLLRAYRLTDKQDVQRACRVSESAALRAVQILSETAPHSDKRRTLLFIAFAVTMLAIVASTWLSGTPAPQPIPISPASVQSVLPEVIPSQEPEEYTEVYVTKNGDKYHKEDCYQVRSSTLLPLDQAAAETAGYDPCKSCQPSIME